MVKLVALRRGVYGTRRLQAGDTFEADRAYARVWVALGKARHDRKREADVIREPQEARDDPPSPQPGDTGFSPATALPREGRSIAAVGSGAGLVYAATDAIATAGIPKGSPGYSEMSMDALRAAYADLTGRPADKRWSHATLLQKVNEARGA